MSISTPAATLPVPQPKTVIAGLATLALGSGFAWWSFTEEQTSALVGVVTAVPGVGGAVFARHHVTAQATSNTK